jgi:hypothetical protein
MTDQPPAELLSIAMSFQVLPLWSLYRNSAEATPDPPSDELLDTATDAPATFAPPVGAVMEPEGAVLSTRTVTADEVSLFPALSDVMTCRS